jgi:membrane-associated protein
VTVLGDLLHLIGRYDYLAVFAALVAGTSHMPWGTFAPYNILGGTVWASAVVSLGYFLWASISLVELLVLTALALALLLHWAYQGITRG